MHTSSGDVYQEERACLFFLVGHLTYVVDFSFGRTIVGGLEVSADLSQAEVLKVVLVFRILWAYGYHLYALPAEPHRRSLQ